MNRVEKLHEKQRSRIGELEKAIKDSHSENYRLKGDYQRLGELLQGNISKGVY